MYKVLLVDDEPAARRTLRRLLEPYGTLFNIVDEAGNGREAVEKIKTLRPDLVFLDIRLPDMSGFEVLQQLKEVPHILFTTAYEEYAIQAFETFAVDYLLKPLREERIAQTVQKLQRLGRLGNTESAPGLQALIDRFNQPVAANSLTVRTGDRINLLRFDQITYLEADDKYVWIYLINGQKHLSGSTLSALTEKLPAHFFRIQKSYLINKQLIKEMHRHYNGRYRFVMNDVQATTLYSGRTYQQEIRKEFGL
jgi:two-component system LytT family response regulator